MFIGYLKKYYLGTQKQEGFVAWWSQEGFKTDKFDYLTSFCEGLNSNFIVDYILNINL